MENARPARSFWNIGREGPFCICVKPRRLLAMDWNRVEGNWKQVKGKVKEQWGKLTDDDLDRIAGKRDQLEGKIQERYGIEKDRVRRDIDDWYSLPRLVTADFPKHRALPHGSALFAEPFRSARGGRVSPTRRRRTTLPPSAPGCETRLGRGSRWNLHSRSAFVVAMDVFDANSLVIEQAKALR